MRRISTTTSASVELAGRDAREADLACRLEIDVANDRAGSQKALLDGRVVDQSAVGATEVAHHVGAGNTLDGKVLPRDGDVANSDVALSV